MPGPNVFDPQLEEGERPEGFRCRRARIGYQLGSELLGVSLFELPPGEAVHFPLGEEGAHQLRNDTQERVRFLALSSSGRPDVVVYPDSGKVGVGERLPHGGGLRAFFPADAAVGYWHGEGG